MKRILAPLALAILMLSSGLAWALPECRGSPATPLKGTGHWWVSASSNVNY